MKYRKIKVGKQYKNRTNFDVNPNWYTSNKRQFVKLKIKGEL